MSNVGMLIAVIILAIITFVLLMVIVKLRSGNARSGEGEMQSLKVQPVSGDS
jgi:hypothetical protein